MMRNDPNHPGPRDPAIEGRPTRKLPEPGPISLSPTVKRLGPPSRPLATTKPAGALPASPVAPNGPKGEEVLPQRVFRIVELPAPQEAPLSSYDRPSSVAIPLASALRPPTTSWPLPFLIGGIAVAILVVALIMVILLHR